MIPKFVVTTRKEVLETLKSEGYYIIGVDGTVPDATHLYDELYDHHKENGADIQFDELPESNIWFSLRNKKVVIITTMVDADAVISAYHILCGIQGNDIKRQDHIDLLRAVSYDCDHLCVPVELAYLGKDAAMIVAAMKQEANNIPAHFNLPSNRKEWTVENKEKYASWAFKQGIKIIDAILYDHWDYEAKAKSYWENVQRLTNLITDSQLVSVYRDCLIFDATSFNEYVDPRCWLMAARVMFTVSKLKPITLTKRHIHQAGEFKGVSYTLGTVPLHKDIKDVNLNNVWTYLTVKERVKNPDCGTWGGRATVGGSPWNTPSLLKVEEVINVVLVNL